MDQVLRLEIDSAADAAAQRAAMIVLVSLCLAFGATGAAELALFTLRRVLSWGDAFGVAMPRWVLLAAAAPALLILARRHRVVGGSARSLGIHALTCVSLGVVVAVVYAISSRTFGPGPSGYTFPVHTARSFLSAIPMVVLVYGTTLGVAHALDVLADRRARDAHAARLEAQLSAAKAAALRAQVQPHFLYNALHGIAALVVDGKRDESLNAVEHLSELLHATLRDGERTRILLAEELELVRHYLAIQTMRFGERLAVRESIAVAANAVLVPPLLLQPLVENAVQHGLRSHPSGLCLTIGVHATDDELHIVVENDGAVLPREWRAESDRGIGLPGIRARLDELYGPAATLRVERRTAGGATARVRLPLALAAQDADAMAAS